MMKTQFTTDQSGKQVAVLTLTMKEYQQFLKDQDAINSIKNIYEIGQQTDDIPEWHKEIALKALKELEDNPDSGTDYETVMEEIEKQLNA